MIDISVNDGYVEKSGAWYSYKGDKIGQGKANAIKYLQEHPDVASELEGKIREAYLQGPADARKQTATVVAAEEVDI